MGGVAPNGLVHGRVVVCVVCMCTSLPCRCASAHAPLRDLARDLARSRVFSRVRARSWCRCQAWNEARPRNAPDSTNCTIAVWHGPGRWRCELKATARKPFASSGVVALQCQPAPPPPPPTPPLRFASIYTSHTVLQAGPARANVWGFLALDPDNGTAVTVEGPGGARVDATLEPLPVGKRAVN